jgi:hypothetical protein
MGYTEQHSAGLFGLAFQAGVRYGKAIAAWNCGLTVPGTGIERPGTVRVRFAALQGRQIPDRPGRRTARRPATQTPPPPRPRLLNIAESYAWCGST